MDDWNLEPAKDLGLIGLSRFRSLQRESGLVESVTRLASWSLIRVGLRLFHNLKIIGKENIPATPSFVMVANHTSHYDTLVLGSAVRLAWRDQLYPIAAGDTFFERTSLAATVTTLINALPVWRRRAGADEVQAMKARLAAGNCIYILFPEGTRTRDGKITEFKPGIGMMVAGTGVPVLPCHLTGTFEASPPNRLVPRFVPITLRIGKPIGFSDVTDTSKGWRTIAAEIETAVRALASHAANKDV